MTAPGLVLAHHPLVDALPAVVPMVVLVGAFAGVVVADRRRTRRARQAERASEQARWDRDSSGSDGAGGRP